MAVTEFHGPSGPLPHVPDDVTLVQFMLDSDHPSRPVKRVLQGNPWMIEDATGRHIGYGEVRVARSLWKVRAERVPGTVAHLWSGERDMFALGHR